MQHLLGGEGSKPEPITRNDQYYNKLTKPQKKWSNTICFEVLNERWGYKIGHQEMQDHSTKVDIEQTWM